MASTPAMAGCCYRAPCFLASTLTAEAEMSATDPRPVPEAPTDRSGVTILDQALWRDLLQNEDDAAFNTAWLGLTCRSIQGAIGAALLLREPAGGLRLAATWP